MFSKKIIKFVMLVSVGLLGSYVTYATAANIGGVAANISGGFENILKLVTAGAYIAGFGLTVASLFKFKQHKDNPQQVQLGTCITMLLIGISLIFLPSLLSTGGSTLFGTATEGKITGMTSTTN